MEWSRSNISAEELERRQREYIEAAMNMAKKAMPATEEVHIVQPAPELAEEPEKAPEPEIIPEVELEPEPQTEPMSQAEPELPEPEPPAPAKEPEPEEKEECAEVCDDEDKTKFGVFGKEELLEAVESGTVSDEGLKRAAEILAEMSSKTETMRKILEQSEGKCEKNSSEQPQTLNGYVNRHNGGSCPRCGQTHNGNHR